MSVHTPASHSIGWDTMASINVANDLTLIPGAKPLPIAKAAFGVGGRRAITHSGPSPIFGMEMVYIEGGESPNLMSVARALQRDKTGLDGCAIFTADGAIRFRSTEKVKALLAQLYQELETNDLIEGRAVMKNNVYTETVGQPEQQL